MKRNYNSFVNIKDSFNTRLETLILLWLTTGQINVLWGYKRNNREWTEILKSLFTRNFHFVFVFFNFIISPFFFDKIIKCSVQRQHFPFGASPNIITGHDWLLQIHRKSTRPNANGTGKSRKLSVESLLS